MGINKHLAITTATLLFGVATVFSPVLAQSTDTGFKLGPAVAECNKTFRDSSKSVQVDYKNKNLTKDERNSKLKSLNQDKLNCIKDAQTKAQQDRDAKRQAKLEELKKAKEERLTKMKAKQEEAKARSEAAKKVRGAQKASKKW